MLNIVRPLLELLGKHEARGDYNTVWGGIRKEDYPRRPITQMTVAEVLAWQESIDHKYMSEASGMYQFMEDTLRDSHNAFGVSSNDRFDAATQDKLALGLLRRRGLDRYLAGNMTAVNFAQNISMEWASMPCTVKDKLGRAPRGQSYYAGDGLNKSSLSIASFLKVIVEVKDRYDAERSAPPPVERPAQKSFWATLWINIGRALGWPSKG